MDPIDLVKNAEALAVVGVSRNKDKYAYRIWRFLRDRGRKVYPVNPAVSEIDGEPCFPSLSEMPGPVGVAVAVVSPRVTETLPSVCREHAIPCLWMQPGAESEKVIEACEREGIQAVTGHCILVEW